ncbi:MAG: glutamate synthase subunit alpha, partial [Candidatus Eremiobacteraeota bacterium]|nr:glutamate synthase subunit alpha [Candidatus Eremiobacteraeota bacterium]
MAHSRDVDEHDACGVGFLADLGGPASHRTIALALQAAASMTHRGALAADGRTGDGAGILCETPRRLLARDLASVDLHVSANHLAALCCFLPRDPDAAAGVRASIEGCVRKAELSPLRWRAPVVNDEILGVHARASRPGFEQLVVDMGPGNVRERMRAAARAVERKLRDLAEPHAALLSCSSTSVVYKALLSSDELAAYFDDLRDEGFVSRFALFHQRFSTNTSPSWRLVQPFRHIAHNGEINTITGNRAWLEARGVPVERGASDSYDLNVAVDTMVGSGYRVDEAVDLLLAPAVDAEEERLKAYYDAH